MSYMEEYYNDCKSLRLTGSQINLTARSDQTVSGSSCNERRRPCSSVLYCRTPFGSTNDLRPKSAEYERQSSQCLSSLGKQKCCGHSSLKLSHFTDSSSKLLQNLLNSSKTTSVEALEDRCPDTDKLSPVSSTSKSENSAEHKKSEKRNNVEFLTADHRSLESEFQRGMNLEVDGNLEKAKHKLDVPEVAEEKTVRFYEGQPINPLPENKFTDKYACFRNSGNAYPCLKNNFRPSCQEPQYCQALKSIPGYQDTPRTLPLNLGAKRSYNEISQSESDKLKTFDSGTEDNDSHRKQESERGTLLGKCVTPRKENCNKSLGQLTDNLREELYSKSFRCNLGFGSSSRTHRSSENFDKGVDISDEEVHEDHETYNEDEQEEEEEEDEEEDMKHDCDQKIDSTYEEIVHLLQTLEEEDSDSVNLDKKESDVDNPSEKVSSEEKIDYLSAVSSYLEEVEKDDGSSHEKLTSSGKWDFTSPRLEELLNKNSVELAHEVFSLKIQIEDQKKGIKLLKDTLAEQKEAKKNLEIEHKDALHKVSSEAETMVQRHQKFIKQLLAEKKKLNETVSKLVEDIKSGEDRYKKNIKAMEEKHMVEIKKAKEMQAAADKIKREKWMEMKTLKIKEMTVKGLEPELSRMQLRQQEEMTELRNLQKAELEAVELRAARRTSELMDELRAELTKEKERAISRETANLRSSLEKEFEDERNKLQQYCQSLKERIRKQEEKFSNQEFEFQQRLLDYRQEEDKKRQKLMREHQENLEDVRRQHTIELKNLKESMEAEREVYLNSYKKQHANKLLEREAELHQQYKKERDREIELIIETLEKESSQIQMELNSTCESKLKRLKDKMESEIREIEANEEALKIKLSDAKSKLSEKEDFITELNSQIRQLQTEITFFKKSCEEMSSEKTKLKDVVRGEFESTINGLIKQKENLEREMSVLKELHSKELAKKDQINLQAKCDMQKELTRVYSRIKTAVNKKEKIIESLREENGATNQRCRQLEFMLDQQRKNLLLQFGTVVGSREEKGLAGKQPLIPVVSFM